MEKEAKKEKSKKVSAVTLANALSPLPLLAAFLICRRKGEINVETMAPFVIAGYAALALSFYLWSKFSEKKEEA